MKISERALSFVFRVYNYGENSLHSILVGMLLKSYGYSDEVVAAGFLHDICKTTEYNVNDIARLFGGKVASLVMTSSSIYDESLPWYEAKRQELKTISDLPLDNLAIICADKIIELEDLKIKLSKNGKNDFSGISVSKENLKWYYDSLYDKMKELNSPLLSRFADVKDAVFSNYYFGFNTLTQYDTYERTSYQEELLKLRKIIGDKNPYIIEFADKDSSQSNSLFGLFDKFLNDVDFRVKVCEDIKPKNRYEDVLLRNKGSISTIEKNLLISSAIKENLMSQIVDGADVIMVDSSVFDFLVYIRIMIDNGAVSKKDFESYLRHYLSDLEFIVNHASVCYDNGNQISNGEYSENNEALENLDTLLNGVGVVDNTKITLIVAGTFLSGLSKDRLLKLKTMI